MYKLFTFYFLAENPPVFWEEVVIGDPGKHIMRSLPSNLAWSCVTFTATE